MADTQSNFLGGLCLQRFTHRVYRGREGLVLGETVYPGGHRVLADYDDATAPYYDIEDASSASAVSVTTHYYGGLMRFAINLPAFNALADARVLAELAHEAEDAGWDGFFLWDHLQTQPNGPVADPWVALTAIAMRTERIRFGALVTPLPRRRPWKFARETATLDQLSHGRLIVGVGIGSDFWREYSAFGEVADNKTHAAMLDESLDVVTGLWSGKPFSYEGKHYSVHDAQFLPTPAQTPRIPIWVAGVTPHKAPLRRAARWDGVNPIHPDDSPIPPDEIREMLAYIGQYRSSSDPFDVVVAGYMGNEPPETATAKLRAYADAGVTWWQEGFLPNDTPEMARARIHQGPPTL